MISQILKTAAQGARMAPLYGGIRGSSPAQKAVMVCKGMATHSLAVLRDGFGQRLPSVVKTPSPSAEPPKPDLPSPSLVGPEWFPPAGLWQARGSAAPQAREKARYVKATDPDGHHWWHLPGMPDSPAAAARTYRGLARFQLACGASHFIAPKMVATALLSVHVPMDEFVQLPLIALVGIGYWASGLTCFALSDGARDSELHQARYRRLNLGMMAIAGALLTVRAVHADLLTPVGAIWTVLQAGLTAGIPFYYYSKTKKDGSVSRDVAGLISSDLRKLLQPVNGWSVVYAALTTAFLGLLTSSIIAPVSTLTSILPAASTPECIALWRNVGAALLVLPAWIVNLKEAAPMHSLNDGLCGVSYWHFMLLMHCASSWQLLGSPEVGPWLHTLATFWGSVGAIGLLRIWFPEPSIRAAR